MLAVFLEKPLLLPVPVALGGGLALVVGLLALGDPDLDLGDAAMVEVQDQRHERHALALSLVPQARQFLARYQELAPAALLVTECLGLLVRRDIGIDQPQFPVIDGGVAL